MCTPCEHALAADPGLFKGANATHRYITCHKCLPDQLGIHVVKAWRTSGEQLWKYLISSLLFTPRGRAIFPAGGPAQAKQAAGGRAAGVQRRRAGPEGSAPPRRAVEVKVPSDDRGLDGAHGAEVDRDGNGQLGG